ncbi:uncharacterized protein BDW43DRAFT_262459 [Aspergillus alliaceus]|uniref:uncharacterized protein n=1 Tax=Petromyces alliaceus TaxID=209559 RepID=UPI0012A6A1DE|nr:uncharacterized protein BDW43DRAFT_262459 [Aspergillus alliaceus]KAB8238711.1 hypothetical protein BDW43DRAFT_262459 [Aspergillus alliaceus]
MASEERAHSLSDTPIIPPSTRSSQRSRSSSPIRPNAQYRGGHLRRAKIFVCDEIPASISYYADTSIFHHLTNYGNNNLHQVSQISC